MKSKALEWCIILPLIPISFAAVISFFIAAGVLLYSVYYFLRFGYWLSSACEITGAMTWQGANVPDACHQFSYDWKGVNQILHSAFRDFEPSLLAVIVGGLLIVAAWVWIFAAGYAARGWSNW